jgi:carboxyl-terminal processing protease
VSTATHLFELAAVLLSLTAMSSRIFRSLLGLALAAAPLTLTGPASAETKLECERLPQLLGAYFQKHISYEYLNDDLRTRAVDSYLNRIDPSKTLFLAEEAEALRSSLMGIFHDVYSGDCSQLESLQREIQRRYQEMEAFVRELVSREDYALDTSVVLVIDPEKRGYPETASARGELYTKLVHFQMSNYLSTDMELAEAKQKLIHRYELMTRRASELEAEDSYAVFLDAFASSLDPHSRYFTAEAMEDFQIDMRLSLDGIGVALSSRDGYSIVEKVIPGGATDRLGVLQPKDKIIAVAQEDMQFVDVIDMDLRDVVRLIRGKRGTKVHLRILRQEETTERRTVTIVRDKINLEERSASLRFEEAKHGELSFKLAVIELPSFYGDRNPTKRQSSRDLKNLLTRVREEKADGLLLDLSRNGGGLLETAVDIAGFFIEEGDVVAVKGTGAEAQMMRDSDDSILFDGPMVVLISRVSASASEIVAGALKDYRRAVLVGDDHTFGKGTVQSMVPLPPGLGGLKVTTALFFRPGGASTQHTGVLADIAIPSLSNSEDFGEDQQPYSLPGQRIAAFVDRSAFEGNGGRSAWAPVAPERISELARRSAARVDAAETFMEIRKKLEEARTREGVIHLAEMIKEKANGGSNPQTDTQPGAAAGDAAISPHGGEGGEADRDEPSPQQLEAIRVLADHVALSRDSDS